MEVVWRKVGGFWMRNYYYHYLTYESLIETYYSHLLIVVALTVVNFFGFLVITRHRKEWVPGLVDFVPTGLPVLFKPARTSAPIEDLRC